MNEETLDKQFEDLVKKFTEENNCSLVVLTLAPKGGWVYVQNYTPDNWPIKINPIAND